MERKTCETCKWGIETKYDDTRECRRMPPTIRGRLAVDDFPTVRITHWCGEHTPRQERKEGENC